MTYLHDPYIALPSLLGLSLLLLSAAWHKLRAPQAFIQVLRSYGINTGERWLARLIPMAETTLAIALLCPPSRAVAAIACATLLMLYAALMSYTLWQGKQIADCGCSLGNSRSAVSAALVWRNLLLTLMAGNLALATTPRQLGTFDLAAMLVITLLGITFYVLANTLIGTHHSTRELFHD